MLDQAFDAMLRARMQAVVVNAESLFYQGKERIAKLAITRRLPTCVWVRELVELERLCPTASISVESPAE
jgi:hypothetical protein